MKNQNKSQLSDFRAKIDGIDNNILDLLKERVEIINQVGEYKKSLGEQFYISSSREADMVRNLVKRANSFMPSSIIVSIWRKIITSANILEQPIRIAIHNPRKRPEYNYIVRDYYSNLVPIEIHDSVTNIISAIEKNEVQIGIFALPDKKDEPGNNQADNWWVSLAGCSKNNIRIFARIPFIDYGLDEKGIEQISLVAVAIKDAERSLYDKTLLLVEVGSEVSRNQLQEAIKESGLSAKIIKTTKMDQVESIIFNLIEVDGFFEQKSLEIQTFSRSKIKPYIKVIGSYPEPIKHQSESLIE